MQVISSKDFDIMLDILGKVASISLKKWRDERDLQGKNLSEEIVTLYKRMTERRYPVKEENLEKLKNHIKNNNTQLEISNLFLPPLEASERFVPVASVEYKSAPTPEISLRVGMYCLNEKSNIDVPGYRLETGHANSNHDYCHVQFTSNPFDENWVRSIPSVSETCPCILIPAKCPVSLVFCMLISFYGKLICQFFPEYSSRDKKYQNPLEFLNY